MTYGRKMWQQGGRFEPSTSILQGVRERERDIAKGDIREVRVYALKHKSQFPMPIDDCDADWGYSPQELPHLLGLTLVFSNSLSRHLNMTFLIFNFKIS
jgi:hypothetical protein